MATKREIITDALGEIGMAEYIFDATPEELQSFLRRLNTLMAQWDGMGIRVGYNFGSDLAAESGLPDTVQDCVACTLALRMAPSFGKTPSQQTMVSAKQGYTALLTTFAKRPVQPYPPQLPRGVGNRGMGVLGQQYFPPTDEVEGLNDGATEY